MADKFNVNKTIRHDLLGTKNDELNENFELYNLMYINHYNYLINIISSLFTWEGLPETVDGKKYRSSFFEMLLVTNGFCAIADTPEYGMVIAPCVVDGVRDIVGEPRSVKLYPSYQQGAMDFPVLDIMSDKFVFCRNDNTETGLLPLVKEAATCLTNVKMSMIANANQQKFPTLICGKRTSKYEIVILKNKVDSFDQYVMVTDDTGLDLDAIKTLNVDKPFVADKLQDTYDDILNNFFMRIGINSIPNAKKERLLKDEVNANNQAVQAAGDIMCRNREEICEAARRIFGLDMSFQRNTDLADSLTLSTDSNTEEVEVNEQVYD